MITAVTAFVPIPGHPRAEEEYHRLAQPLLGMESSVPLLSATGVLEDCWLYQHICDRYTEQDEITHSVSDNPKKNSNSLSHCAGAKDRIFSASGYA